MRVLEVVNYWPAETFIQRHVAALQALDFPVEIVARRTFAPERSASLGDPNEGTVARIMPNFNHLGFAGKLSSLRFLTKKSVRRQDKTSVSEKTLLGYFERLRPDLIHFHDAGLAASMRWIPIALGIPYTLSLRGSDIQVFPLQSSSQCAAIRAALEGAAGIHAVCRDLGLRAERLVGHDLDFSVINTTVPVPASMPRWGGARANGKIHFISSGRFMWRKRFGDLLVALRGLLDQGMDARLTIVGAGPDLDQLLYLRKLLELDAMVDFPGKLTYEQTLGLFWHADAYVQSSLAEGLSNSLAEAMANGVPVFATDVNGTREVIDEGVSGFLLAPLAPERWVGQLLRVLDRPLMTQVRAVAYEKARQVFSARCHADAFSDFYEEAAHCR